MLDKNALSQLQTLKQEIRESIPRFKGRVRATVGRYGFVNTDDGQSYFLTPEEMDKVFPGDTIEFRVESSKDGKQQAVIEKLIDTEIQEIFGRYIVRGKGHFIEPDHNTFSRWLFVPPAERKGAQEGDLVRAHIHLHPYPKGKSQAAIDEVIGNITETGVEHRYTLKKWGFAADFSPEVLAEATRLTQEAQPLTNRTDLTHLPFVTIDSASTRDLDDALFAEAHSDGWNLWIAIADPSAYILPGSILDKEALQRSTSVYFPDLVLPMLPADISEQLCSLQAEQTRPAVVVELRIAEDGSIIQTHIHQALIKSHAKLSYTQVSQFVNGENNDFSAELQGPLLHLNDCANALAQWRIAHALVMEERPDFKLIFDQQGKVQDIVCIERTMAHRIVEECMLACNLSIATWLAEQNSGFFIEHAGLRNERIAEVSSLLKEELAIEKEFNLAELADFVYYLQQAEQSSSTHPLRMIVARQQDRSYLTLQAKPHFGLGFAYYTTFTSPLRKYTDLLIHRIVKSLLNGETPELPSEEQLKAIQNSQNEARLAAWQTEVWLKLQWLEKQDKESVFAGKILHITPSNFTVRLADTGIEGLVDRRKIKGWVYNSKTLSHNNGEQSYILGQDVRVKLQNIEPQARNLQLSLVEPEPMGTIHESASTATSKQTSG